MPPLDNTGTPPPFDPSQPFETVAAPVASAAAPPPFDPTKPFETVTAPPFDPSKPFQAGAPQSQYTAKSPYVVDPKAISPEAFAAWREQNPGAYVRMPDGRVLQNPAPAPEEVAKQEAAAYDTSGMTDTRPSTGGVFGRGVIGGVLPSAASMVGMGAGAQLGAAAGAPFAPITGGLSVPIGMVGGALIGGLGAAYGTGKLQDVALEQMPPVQKFLGQDPETRAADEAAHPYAAFAGRLAPQVAFLRPGLPGHAVPAGASAIQRALGSKFAGPTIGAGLGAGQEAITEAVTEGHVDPVKLGMAGVAGAAMTHPTPPGNWLMMQGARPAQAGIELVAPGLGARVQPPPAPGAAPPPERPPVGTAYDIDMTSVNGDRPERWTVFGYTDDGLVILKGNDGDTTVTVPVDTLAQYGRAVETAPEAGKPLALPAPQRALPPPATGYGEGFTMPPEGSAPEATRTEFAPENVPPVEPPPVAEPRPPESVEQQDAALRRDVAEGRPAAPNAVADQLAQVQKEITPDQTSVPRGTVAAPEGGGPAAPQPPEPQAPAVRQQEAPAAPSAPPVVSGEDSVFDAGVPAPEQPSVARPDVPPLSDRDQAAARYIIASGEETARVNAASEAKARELGLTPDEFNAVIRHRMLGNGPEPPPEVSAKVDELLRWRQAQPEPDEAALRRQFGARKADVDRLGKNLEGQNISEVLDAWRAQLAERPPEPAPPAEPIAETPAVPEAVPPTEARPEAPLPNTEEPKNAPTVSDEKHTKTGKDIYAVRFPQKPDIDGLGAKAKNLGGYWSSYRGAGARPGWMFKTRESADRFADWATSHLGMPQRLTDAEAAGRAAGEAGTLRAINRDPVGQGLMQGAPDAREADRVLKAWIQGWHEGKKAEAPAAKTEEPLAPDEHPGLVIKSLETGKTTEIQPPGTRQPSQWNEIGKNSDGQTLYEDQRGVRSIVENGVRSTEPVGMRPTRGGPEITTDRTSNPEYEIAAEPAAPKGVEEGYVPSGMDPELYRMRQDVVKARDATETEPTDAQKEAGNYAKGRVRLAPGIEFVMENPRGSMREGPRGDDGKPAWVVESMPADYGYIARTTGADTVNLRKPEGVDAYLGDDPTNKTAYVIDQVHADTGAFDEHKIMWGFDSWAKAREAYEDAFSDGRGGDRIGNVTPMPVDDLRAWLKNGDTRNPIGQQALRLAEPAKAPAEMPAHNAHPVVRLAENIQARLEHALKNRDKGVSAIGPRELQERAEGIFGSKLSEGKFTRAEMYDALELAVNRYIRAHEDVFDPRADLRAARQMVSELQELKNSLPTQTVRAGEKDTFQQFSTPPDYAFAANWLAKIGEHDRVLEPSAGTGSLAVHAMNAKPEAVYVNELSKNRAPLVESLGPDRAFRENAEQLHGILPQDVKPSVVVMNPPFSQTAGRMGDKTVLTTGARHIEQALSRLESGGRLVAIVGRGMSMGAPTFRNWWSKIGRDYDIRANVGVDGKVYQKYGTNFATRVLVIDKNPPSGRAPVIADVESIPDLMTTLEGVRDERVPATERTGAAEQLAAEPGGEAASVGSEGAARPGEPLSGATPATGVREGSADARPGRELSPRSGERSEPAIGPEPKTGAGDALAAVEPERGRPAGADQHPDTGTGERPGLGERGTEPNAMVLRPEGEPGSVLPPRAPSGIVESDLPEIVRVQEAAANPETAGPITENVYEPYKPQRITIKGATEHPTKLVQSAAMASVMPPEVNYTPKLPPAVIKDGKLSAAQLEAVTYAGHAHSQMLPEFTPKGEATPVTYRRGFFVGDGTGVGKGAQVAGIMLDNWMQGRQKALWVSESRALIKDAQRDWAWVGRDPNDIFDWGKVAKPGAELKQSKGIGFLTYDTLKGAEKTAQKDDAGKSIKGKTRVDQIVDWLGKDFDGVIAFDESHNLGNSIQIKGKRGMTDPAQKALAGIELQEKLPNARVVYVSATGATEVMNLAYAERLGLWGPGTAFPDKREFINNISSGGVAAMELVARDMKAMGSYIARNLSFDGVEYERLEHKLTTDQRRIYDDLADGWQEVLQNMEAALLKTTGAENAYGEAVPDKGQRTAALSAFWSGHQRFFNQIITSMQMPSVIKAIERDLKNGKQAVLQLVNTNEASQNRAISRAKSEGADLEDLDMTPRDQLIQMVDKSFPTTQRETYLDENGNERSRDVVDSAGNPVQNPEAVAMKDALLSKLGSIRVPDGPLEMLINHFGHDNVAEITGRTQRVVSKPDEKGVVRKQQESRPGSANITEANAFQDAKKKILVFSQAGMTGRSYHADNSSQSAGARRAHYLVQAGWRADKALQGFGRTHRTNQASAPIFNLVTTDLQGQRRFMSSIARRLSQLGALTKGERRAGESGMFSARDNLESNEAKDALGALWRDIQRNQVEGIQRGDFERQTGLKLSDANGNPSEPPEITQFLNRLLSLKFDMQNKVFGEFEGRLDTAVERAAEQGTLDVGTETLKADRITKQDDRVVHTDPQSGAETRYVRLKVENKTKPRSFEDVAKGVGTGRSQPKFYVAAKQSGKVYAVSESHNVTDKEGRVIPQYRLTDPLDYRFTDRNKIEGYSADKYWERIEDGGEAKRRWDENVAKIPEYREHDEHLITGAILPIWDRLGPWPRVYRLQTDAGEKLLGRTVSDREIDGVLRKLGADDAVRQYTPAQVAEQIMEGGRATLANDWSLRRSTVANEPRIELVGPDYSHNAELTNAGVFTERIGYQTRYFVPTGPQAETTLASIMQRRPVVEMLRNLMRDESGAGPNPFDRGEPAKKPDRLEWDETAKAFRRVPADAGGGGGGRTPPRPPRNPPGPGDNGGPPLDDAGAALRRIMDVDERGWAEKAKDFAGAIREDLGLRLKMSTIDDLASLEAQERALNKGDLLDASLSPTKMARLTRDLGGVMSAVVGKIKRDGSSIGGALRYNAKDGAFELVPGSKPFVAVFKPRFDANEQDLWALWAITSRAKRLKAEGRENNVSQEDIDRWSNLHEQYPQFLETMKEWRELNRRTLDMLEETGVVNGDQRLMWEHEDYVPFFRAMDDDVAGPRSGGRSLNFGRTIKQLKGGEEKVANLYENMVRNLSSMIDHSMKNEAKRRIAEYFSGTDVLTPMSKVARANLQTEESVARLEAMGLDPKNMTVQQRVAASDLFGMLQNKDPSLFVVMENGKPQYYKINDPLLMRALTSLGPDRAYGLVRTLLGGAKTGLTKAVTIDPTYMLRNLMRDTPHAWIVTGHGFTPGVDTMKGLVKSLRDDPSALAIMAGGGGGGHFYAAAPEKVRRTLETKDFKDSVIDSPRKVWRALEHIGRASEQANRIAIYDSAIAEGASKAEAVYRAKDVLDYTRRGDSEVMRFLIDTVPFFNARIQGLHRLYRGARENPKSFLLRGSLLAAGAIALWAMNKDDERYKALEDWDRDGYFHFFVGDQHFRLPKPFEVGAIFGSLPEMLLNYSQNGRSKELAHAFAGSVANQIAMSGPYGLPWPQAIRPMVDLYANKDSFSGRPIVTRAEEKLAPELQYGPHSSPIITSLAGSIGASPEQAEFLLSAYGGTVATYLLAAADAGAQAAGVTTPKASQRLDQMPFIKSFVREEPALGTRWLREFYDLKHEADQLYNTMKQYQKQGDAAALKKMTADTGNMAKIGMHKGMTKVAENLGVIRQAMARIDRDPNMDPAEKRRRLDALIANRNKIAETVRPMLKHTEGLSATP